MKSLLFTDCVDLVGSACKPFSGIKKYVSTGAVDVDHIIDSDTEIVNYDGKPSRANLEVMAGDVLFAKMQGTKKTLMIDSVLADHIYSTGFCAVRAKKGILTKRCLYHLLTSEMFLSRKDKNCSGATQKAITNAGLGKIALQVPSIDEQDSIANQLDTIKGIITKRQQELSSLDDLIKARFVEMFGDRWSNNRSWSQKSLAEIADFYNGKAHEQVIDEDGEYILVTSRCIASDLTDYRRTNALLFPLEAGDICMVMSDVPNGQALAKCIWIDEDNKYTLNQRICCFRNYELNPVFFLHLLNRHEYLLSFNDGDSQTNLRKNDLLACPVICPPMGLQEQFAAFIVQIDRFKSVIQKSLDETRILLDSLMQQYFG